MNFTLDSTDRIQIIYTLQPGMCLSFPLEIYELKLNHNICHQYCLPDNKNDCGNSS